MNIHLLSDLHLSVHPFDPPQTDADLVVIAGDLGRPEQAMAWARQLGKTTVFVAGNHKFYGSDLTTTFERLHAAAQGSLVQILERQTWAHQGVRFLGCTLWSDHRLFEGEARAQARQRAQSMIADFPRIAKTPGGATLTPDDAQAEFDHAVAWLDTQFALSLS
ncbi:hypothetical protein GALL_330010 [mine drainage metagenome]|uniref:Calcineurin-like phosphoesterase domain-containing protein n=1 Tax=mine drainage metagenome TaxID=410659 RepID=A0A1J5QP51_9ZZZZ